MKKIIRAMCLILSLVMVGALSIACNNETGGGSSKSQNYTMEIEYTNLDGLTGAGNSNSKSGVMLIEGDGSQAQKDMGWSNGYMVVCTLTANLTFTFAFNSDADADATLVLRLGSEIGDLTLGSDVFSVKLNDKEVTYNNMFIANSPQGTYAFDDKPIAGSVAIKKGANVITLTVKENTIYNGKQGGPMIDCIKLKTKAKLTWTDKTENIQARDEI